MGKCGFRLVKKQKLGLAQRMWKKGIFFAILMSLVMFTGHRSKHMMEIIKRNKKHHRGLQDVREDEEQPTYGRRLSDDLVKEDEEAPTYGRRLQELNEEPIKEDEELVKEDDEDPTFGKRFGHRGERHWGRHGGRHHGRFNKKPRSNLTDSDVIESDTKPEDFKYRTWDGRKEAYAMFAPKLWDKAKHQKGASHEEPEAKKDHKKKHCCAGVCPLKAILFLTILFHLYNIKCLKDALEARKQTIKASVSKMKIAQANIP